ncbi:unnamed protein product [Moneuplotes crassus]|uniref:Uncharacterized protein n=1 Tax=Euplotes crassus TaxID=5936 RepID=A0AAD1UL42_EUPCR|nr:unnamed protein product [Moneuplotes crassus]
MSFELNSFCKDHKNDKKLLDIAQHNRSFTKNSNRLITKSSSRQRPSRIDKIQKKYSCQNRDHDKSSSKSPLHHKENLSFNIQTSKIHNFTPSNQNSSSFNFKDNQKFLEKELKVLKANKKCQSKDGEKSMTLYLLEKVTSLECRLEQEQKLNKELTIARESNNQELILAETKIFKLTKKNKQMKEKIDELETELKMTTAALLTDIEAHKAELTQVKTKLEKIEKLYKEEQNSSVCSLKSKPNSLTSVKSQIKALQLLRQSPSSLKPPSQFTSHSPEEIYHSNAPKSRPNLLKQPKQVDNSKKRNRLEDMISKEQDKNKSILEEIRKLKKYNQSFELNH